MGLLVDTDIFIRAERSRAAVDFSRWLAFGEAFIAAITVSELLVGVHRASTPARKRAREAFVEGLLAAIPALDFSAAVARTHAKLLAGLPVGVMVPAHDALIGATALHYGHHVLTHNRRDFARMPNVQLVDGFDGNS